MQTIRLAKFQSQLARQLVTLKAPVGRPRLSTSPNPNAVFHWKAQPKDFHLDRMHHLPQWTATCEPCKGQGCSSPTFVMCCKCEDYLCFNKKRSYFARVHFT
ncbi:hypothetical protein RRG08_010209 [Elysia crispata]|uniref:Transposase Tc5 C-terminal domain-containing protein n=1 Tax=Elysia crispata TaxID=231223 RepID=A0AAE1AKN6_9GAST|nr:hypothetical protein RRG08_010209 [Elysia crispata]